MAMASASRDAHAAGGAAGTDQAAPAVVKIAVEDPHAGAAAANRRENQAKASGSKQMHGPEYATRPDGRLLPWST